MIVSTPTPTPTQIMTRRETASKKSIVLLLQMEVVHVPVRKRSRPPNGMYACMCSKTVVKRCNAIFSYLSLVSDNYASSNKPARPKSIQKYRNPFRYNVTFASLNSNTVYCTRNDPKHCSRIYKRERDQLVAYSTRLPELNPILKV